MEVIEDLRLIELADVINAFINSQEYDIDNNRVVGDKIYVNGTLVQYSKLGNYINICSGKNTMNIVVRKPVTKTIDDIDYSSREIVIDYLLDGDSSIRLSNTVEKPASEPFRVTLDDLFFELKVAYYVDNMGNVAELSNDLETLRLQDKPMSYIFRAPGVVSYGGNMVAYNGEHITKVLGVDGRITNDDVAKLLDDIDALLNVKGVRDDPEKVARDIIKDEEAHDAFMQLLRDWARDYNSTRAFLAEEGPDIEQAIIIRNIIVEGIKEDIIKSEELEAVADLINKRIKGNAYKKGTIEDKN